MKVKFVQVSVAVVVMNDAPFIVRTAIDDKGQIWERVGKVWSLLESPEEK